MIAVPALAQAQDGADDPWRLCPAMPRAPSVDVPAPSAPGATRAAAESAESRGATTILRGDATIRRQQRTLRADRIQLDREQRRARAAGNVFIEQGGLYIQGERGDVNLDTGAFTLDAARYSAEAAHAQGEAARVTRDERGVSRLEGASYSTCPPEDEDWRLTADTIELDPNTRQGVATNALLRFKGVPLFYTPWFRFPIGDERMSGLLVPSFGSSSSSGTTVGIPYYWNAAPNFDATIEPRYLSDRGGQLRTEWRWLGAAGYWQLNNEYLPNDALADEDRILTRIEHDGDFGPVRTDIQAESVSDDDYFEDLSSNLSLSSQRNLRRRADLRWNTSVGNLLARYESYQTLAGSEPYDQVPQLQFTGGDRSGRFETDYTAELVNFEHESDPTGLRLNLRPEVTWSLERPGWFIRPTLGWDYTAYDLDRVDPAAPATPDRSLPLLSLDTGLVFERFGERFVQTLEPRAFYVYVPEESQDDLPVFDTGEFEFSSAQLFRARRFTGPDRLADANRLTLALTTRLLDRASGRQVLRASAGAITYFDDREVQLRRQPTETDNRSDLALELAVDPTERWGTRTFVRWNPRDDRTEEGTFSARYDGGENRLFNAGYRYDRDSRETVDLSFAWPIGDRWTAVGATNYSLFEERNFETLLGAEYESCCWKVRAVARQYAGGSGQETGFSIELVLKGLGSVGGDAGSLLDRAILGYSR